MRDAVLFDLDGTLVDSLPDIRRGLHASLTGRADVSCLTAARVQAMVGHGARVLVERALEACGLPRGEDAVESALQAFRAAYAPLLPGDTHAFPGVHAMLRSLVRDGVPIGVATNKPGPLARTIVQARFAGLLSVVVGPDDAGAHKPDPAMLAMAAAALQARPALYVGDSPVDIVAARALGIPCVAVTFGLGDVAGCAAPDVDVVHDAHAMLGAIRARLEVPR